MLPVPSAGKPAEAATLVNLTVVNEAVDPTFRFMTVDWDGQIRMDPSSPYAMQRLLGLKESFELAFACDTDHDRHGIVTKSAGLLATLDAAPMSKTDKLEPPLGLSAAVQTDDGESA